MRPTFIACALFIVGTANAIAALLLDLPPWKCAFSILIAVACVVFAMCDVRENWKDPR